MVVDPAQKDEWEERLSTLWTNLESSMHTPPEADIEVIHLYF